MSKSWKRKSSRWDDDEWESERRFRDKKNINKKNRQNKHKREMIVDPVDVHREIIEQSKKRWFHKER